LEGKGKRYKIERGKEGQSCRGSVLCCVAFSGEVVVVGRDRGVQYVTQSSGGRIGSQREGGGRRGGDFRKRRRGRELNGENRILQMSREEPEE